LNIVYILSAVRTPIGKFGGSLVSLTLPIWAWWPRKQRSNVPECSRSRWRRRSSATAGRLEAAPIPRGRFPSAAAFQEVPAYTVNKACASGLKSISLGFQEIATGNLECVLAGGTESMSRLPYYLDGARWGYRLGNQELVDGMYRDGFFCPMAKMLMGETAEVLAVQYKITREEQDQFALVSQQRAAAAQSSG